MEHAGGVVDAWSSAGRCADVGRALLHGVGLDADPARARRLFAHGCEAGDPSCCAALGYERLFGAGVPAGAESAASGLELLHRACRGGSEAAYGYLGRAHELGAGGLTRDLATARSYYETGCALGDRSVDPEACYRLAQLIERGLVPDRTPARLPTYYRHGCRALDRGVKLDACRRAIALGALPEGAEDTGYWYARVENALKPSCEAGARDLCLLVPR